jgi:hypothetical protein
MLFIFNGFAAFLGRITYCVAISAGVSFEWRSFAIA